MNDAILYERYSPRPDPIEEVESIDVQHSKLVAYCDLAGLNPTHVIQDPDTSARTPLVNREKGRVLIDTIEREGLRHVVVNTLERIFRNVPDGRHWLDAWAKEGISLHVADQNKVAFDCSTAHGKLVANIFLTFAEFGPEYTAERTSEAMQFKQRNGARMSRHIPYGKMFDPARIHETKPKRRDKSSQTPYHLCDCPEEQIVISSVKDLAAKGMTPRQIGNTLQDQGVLCRGREHWRTRLIAKILERETTAIQVAK